jgi:two-component system, LytTR family, sensor kinase
MKKATIKIVSQVIAWTIFFCVPFFFTPPDNTKPQFFPIVIPWLYVTGFYYFNYLFLIPRLLFRKRVILYSLIIIAITGLFIFLPEIIFNLDKITNTGQKMKVDIALGRMAFFLTFLIVFIISSGISILNELFRYQNRQYQIEIEKSRAELAYFQSQIHPHFLFNTLYNIYHLTVNKSPLAPKAILKLSDIMRFLLDESSQDSIPIEKEVEVISQYIDLQKLRIPGQTKVIFQFNNNRPGVTIAPLLFIPLVENAFKYGISSRVETTIFIELAIKDNFIEFRTFNKKISHPGNFESTHIGLKNIENRLKLLYPDNYVLNIANNEDDFTVYLKILI